MKITDIRQQVKRAGRYSIYVDEKFAFGVNESQMLSLGLYKGKEITEAELVNLKQESEIGKIFDRILNLLSIRPRSEWELREYLRRKGQSPALIDTILNRLSKLGYVNDEDFAKRWVSNRRLLKPISSLKLRAELKQKRIDNQVIDEVLSADDTKDTDVIKDIIERKKHRYPDTNKLMQYLARQGFRYDDIKSALSELS